MDVKFRYLQRSHEKDLSDSMFDDVLEIMNVSSFTTFPKIVQTTVEAQQLFDIIYPKLQQLQVI